MRYDCTAAGLRLLNERRSTVAQIEERTGVRVRAEHDLRPLLDRFAERVMRVSGRASGDDVERVLEHAAVSIEKLQGGPTNGHS